MTSTKTPTALNKSTQYYFRMHQYVKFANEIDFSIKIWRVRHSRREVYLINASARGGFDHIRAEQTVGLEDAELSLNILHSQGIAQREREIIDFYV